MSIKYWLSLVALLLLPTPALANSQPRYGTGDIDPYPASNERFSEDRYPGGLNTGCTFRSEGPLKFTVKVDRYVGKVKSDGTLEDPAKLIEQGVISRVAELIMPAYDIDLDQGEIDEVYFNGRKLDKPLQGSNGTWYENQFSVPIEWVKFAAARGENGQKPVAAENEIMIDIDTNNQGWCTSIDWGQVHFKAMAPLLLIHGTGANPRDAWEIEPGVTEYLTSLGVPFEHRIQLIPNGTIDANSQQLYSIVQNQAQSFGVQKVHLVGHSKGGLDSRRYLSNRYNPEKEVSVLSLHTLSTPHQGSILADISVAQRNPDGGSPVSQDDEIDAFIVGDHYLALGQGLLGIGADRPALDDLRIADVADFNSSNPMPPSVKLYTYSANADVDGNREITANEARPLIPQRIPDPIAAYVGNLSYQILGRVATVKVDKVNQLFGLVKYKTVEPQLTYPDTNFQVNDLLVTDTSSQHPSQRQHFPPFARNHRDMKDPQTMDVLLDRIRQDFPTN